MILSFSPGLARSLGLLCVARLMVYYASIIQISWSKTGQVVHVLMMVLLMFGIYLNAVVRHQHTYLPAFYISLFWSLESPNSSQRKQQQFIPAIMMLAFLFYWHIIARWWYGPSTFMCCPKGHYICNTRLHTWCMLVHHFNFPACTNITAQAFSFYLWPKDQI